ncbi:MAG TPA: hypothetical protein VG266_10025 [Candidatus Dormibacteraeota bacterium]|jgi:hypothetical protein|nr:hypothetical protein [Candidatus Dormibacteraeota bacterium]
MLGRRASTAAVADSTTSVAEDIGARAAEIASEFASRAVESAREAQRVATPVLRSAASSAAGTLSEAAEKAADMLAESAERLAQNGANESSAVIEAARERVADAAEAFAESVRPRRRGRRMRRLVIVGTVIGSGVVVGRIVRQKLGARNQYDDTPSHDESIPIPSLSTTGAAVEHKPDAVSDGQAAPGPAAGGNGVLAATQGASEESEG